MIIGIESTAHSFGIGLIKDGRIIADVRNMYKPKPGVGIHPDEARKHHEKVSHQLLQKLLNETGITVGQVRAVAYSKGPGLPPCLKTGLELAKSLQKPLYGVNHCVAHIEIGKNTTKAKDPIVVYISGGNTQIIGFSRRRYRIFGETIDIPLGNAIDTIGRSLGLDFPSGPEVEKLAEKGKYIELPYSVKGMDLSYSGLVTACKNLIQKHSKEDICYSFQETAFAMLTEITERALAHTEKNEVLLVGGVAANKRLYNMMSNMCKERGAKTYLVPQKWAGDNGSMIGYTAWLAHKSGQKPETKPDFLQKWRTDEVEIPWM